MNNNRTRRGRFPFPQGRKKWVVCALVFCIPLRAALAQDFGLTLRSLPVLSNGETPPGTVEYTASAAPWFAAPLGDQGDLSLSGGISAVYADETWKFLPEVYRFEIAWRFRGGLHLKAGRLSWGEPRTLLMNGLFDGIALGLDLENSRLAAGVFYTGLLYKKTASITMSPGDYRDYHDKDTYFASRRLAFALDWELRNLAHTEAALDLGISGQLDLNETGEDLEGDTKIHSQYIQARAAFPFFNYGHAEAGTLAGMIENGDTGLGFCFALSGSLSWLPPGGPSDRLSLGTAFSSGAWNEKVRAFLPITTIAQGKVLRSNISGLARVEAGYTVRLHRVLSAELSAAYFFRTDSSTYRDSGLDSASRSPLLGGEVSGSLGWTPVSDISFSLGGGAFFPQWGRAFAPDAPVKWRVSLETIFSF
jgi:hypothetical protein